MKTSTFCIFVAALVLLAGSVLTRPNSALASDSVPLSSPIYDDLDRLAGMGMITSEAKESRPYSKAKATKMALEAATNIARKETAPDSAMELVTRVRQFLARDENSAAEPENRLFELSFSSKVLNRYVGETGVVSYNRPVSQNDLTITHVPSGIYLDIWQSISLSHTGRSTNEGNEIDYFIGWSGDMWGIGVDTGIGYFDLITLFNMPAGDVTQPYIELNKKIAIAGQHALTPYARIEYGIPAKGNAKEFRGLYVHTGLKHGWQVTDAISVNQKAAIIFDDGAYGADRAWVGAYEAAPSYRFREWLSLDLSGKVVGPFTGVTDGRTTQFIGSAGISLNY